MFRPKGSKICIYLSILVNSVVAAVQCPRGNSNHLGLRLIWILKPFAPRETPFFNNMCTTISSITLEHYINTRFFGVCYEFSAKNMSSLVMDNFANSLENANI